MSLLILSVTITTAQQVVPMGVYNTNRPLLNINKKKIVREQLNDRINQLFKVDSIFNVDPMFTDGLKDKNLIKKKINQLQIAQEYLKLADDADAVIDETTKIKDSITLQLIGLGGITDLESIKTAGGNAAIGFTIDWGTRAWCKDCCRMRPRNLVYALYNTRTGSSSDTESIQKTFLFPDISKRDATIGYEYHMSISHPCDSCNHNGLWFATPFAEVSTSHYSDASNNKFRSLSAIIGCKISYQAVIDLGGAKNFGLSFNPYYNVIDVDSKESLAFNTVLGESNLPTTFRCVGLNVVGTISDFQIFANWKYVLNGPDINRTINSTELKGSNVILGVLLSTNIFTAKIPR